MPTRRGTHRSGAGAGRVAPTGRSQPWRRTPYAVCRVRVPVGGATTGTALEIVARTDGRPVAALDVEPGRQRPGSGNGNVKIVTATISAPVSSTRTR
jgi:hypothetical protein